MCGFLKPNIPRVDEGAAKQRAEELEAQRKRQAEVEAEKVRQNIGKQRGRASLNNARTGSVGVVDLKNTTRSLFSENA